MIEGSVCEHPEGELALAPGSLVIIRDEEWLVESVDSTEGVKWVHVRGVSELVKDTSATFSSALDTITPFDPSQTKVVADRSPGYRCSRLWLEAIYRKTAVPIGTDEKIIELLIIYADRHTLTRGAYEPK
ncbi:hypothetical protein [Stomatohabitans albus]|uniref:hypothetical protein n=1 Tax=Stomatohabitans albus TaxID=3110766 RepID=UPI00300C7A14